MYFSKHLNTVDAGPATFLIHLRRFACGALASVRYFETRRPEIRFCLNSAIQNRLLFADMQGTLSARSEGQVFKMFQWIYMKFGMWRFA
jgi:hypothetical protein